MKNLNEYCVCKSFETYFIYATLTDIFIYFLDILVIIPKIQKLGNI